MTQRTRFGVGLLSLMLILLNFHGLSAADGHGQSPGNDGQGPIPAIKPLDQSGRMQLSDQDRCPVCGMFPAKRPGSAAAMVLKEGRTYYFCANGCLLRAWRQSERRLGVPPDSIVGMVVQDYFSGESLAADQAWWVAGSDVVGPMGPALVALGSEAAVTAFRKRHGGQRVFRLDQVDDALWANLFPPKDK